MVVAVYVIAEEWQITDQGNTTYVLGLDVEREPRAALPSQTSHTKQVAADYSEVVKKFDGVPNIGAAANRMLATQRAIAKGESPSNDDSKLRVEGPLRGRHTMWNRNATKPGWSDTAGYCLLYRTTCETHT